MTKIDRTYTLDSRPPIVDMARKPTEDRISPFIWNDTLVNTKENPGQNALEAKRNPFRTV